ncbi:MAG: AI-2E family transporter [Blautia sp.]
MELNKKNMQKLMCLILFAALIFVGLQHFDIVIDTLGLGWNIVFPFVLGAAIAFILNVPMQFLERKLFSRVKEKNTSTGGKGALPEGHDETAGQGRYKRAVTKMARPVSLVLSLILVVCIIMVVVLVVVPDLTTTVISLGKNIEQSIPKLQQWAMKTFHDNAQITQWVQSVDMNWEKMLQSVVDVLRTGATNVLSSTLSVTMGIVSAVVNLCIGFVFACYILLQKEKLSLQVKKAMYAILPEKRVGRIIYICKMSYRTFSNFITGQCIEAVILGLMFFVAMSIFRFPYALLVGVLIAFTALIPIFGAFIGCVVGALLILVVSPMKALMFLILFFVLQQIEGNLIYPHVVGSSVGLPSIWVLVAVTVGGNLMGIAGMLIFIPGMSVLYSLFREWVYGRLKRRKITVK